MRNLSFSTTWWVFHSNALIFRNDTTCSDNATRCEVSQQNVTYGIFKGNLYLFLVLPWAARYTRIYEHYERLLVSHNTRRYYLKPFLCKSNFMTCGCCLDFGTNNLVRFTHMKLKNHKERHDIKPWDDSLSCSKHDWIWLNFSSFCRFLKKVREILGKTLQIFS